MKRPKLQALKPRIALADISARGLRTLKSESDTLRKPIYDKRRWRDHVVPAKRRRDPLCQACAHAGITLAVEHVDHWEPLQAVMARGGDPYTTTPTS